MKLVLLIAIVVSVVLGEDRCCIDGQFRMRVWEKRFASKGDKQLPPRRGVMEVYGDSDKNVNVIVLHGQSEGFVVNVNYNTNTTYTFNKQIKYCIKGEPDSPNYQCVQKDAVKIETAKFGGESGLPINIWQGTFNYKGAIGTYSLGISDECVPLFEGLSGKTNEEQFDTTYLFSNFQNNVKDQSIFDVPQFCQ